MTLEHFAGIVVVASILAWVGAEESTKRDVKRLLWDARAGVGRSLMSAVLVFLRVVAFVTVIRILWKLFVWAWK